MAKNKGKYENGIVSLQGMQSIKCISRELLHVDKTSGMSSLNGTEQYSMTTPNCS